MFIDWHVIMQLSATLWTTNNLTKSQKHCLLAGTFLPSGPAATPSHSQNPSRAELDMHKVMHAAAGPNYETGLITRRFAARNGYPYGARFREQ